MKHRQILLILFFTFFSCNKEMQTEFHERQEKPLPICQEESSTAYKNPRPQVVYAPAKQEL